MAIKNKNTFIQINFDKDIRTVTHNQRDFFKVKLKPAQLCIKN